MKKILQIILALMVFKFFAYETQSLRTEWDNEKSIMDPRVQHLSYIFEETGERLKKYFDFVERVNIHKWAKGHSAYYMH